MHDFVAALRGLTVRGRCFVSAGVTCCLIAFVIGEHDLLRVGLLMLLLPVAAAAFVCRTRYRLACTRRIDPPRVSAGGTVSVRIRLDNVSRLASSALLVEDHAPHRLGSRARFVLDKIEPSGTRDLSYRVRAQLRGRYRIGPMAIRLTDPFGLCELSRSFRSYDELVVAPTVEKLPSIRPAGGVSPSTDRRTARASSGADETTTRPYRSGDDLRHVHWKTTARVGELMVRREERSSNGGATVLLDTREDAWVGGSPSPVFEWAVSAAGSIAVHLAQSGSVVRLLHDTSSATGTSASAPTTLLDDLAVVTTTTATSLSPALAAVRSGAQGTLVVVLGRTDAGTASAVAAARPRSAPAIAVLADLVSWGASRAAANDLEATRLAFSRQGWVVLVASYGVPLAELWPRLPSAARAAHRRAPGGVGVTAGSGGTTAW